MPSLPSGTMGPSWDRALPTLIHTSLAQRDPWPCLGRGYLVELLWELRMGVMSKAQSCAPVPIGDRQKEAARLPPPHLPWQPHPRSPSYLLRMEEQWSSTS